MTLWLMTINETTSVFLRLDLPFVIMTEDVPVDQPIVVDVSEASQAVVIRFPSFIVDLSEVNGVLYMRQRLNWRHVYADLNRRLSALQRLIEDELGVSLEESETNN